MPDGLSAAPAMAADWRRLVAIDEWPLVDPPPVLDLLKQGIADAGPRIDACFAAQLEALRVGLTQPLLRWPRPGTGRFDRLLLVGQMRAGTASLGNLLTFVGLAHLRVQNLLLANVASALIAPVGDPFWFDLTPYTLGSSVLNSTHAPPSPRLVEHLRRQDSTGVVLLVRDPRDALVSFARMARHAGWIHPAFGRERDLALVQRWSATGRLFSEAPYGRPDAAEREIVYWPSYFNWLQSALMLAALPNCVVLRFEEAFDQSDGRRLFQQLRDERLSGVEWPVFEPAYHGTMLFRSVTGRDPGQIDPAAHLARGQSGIWQEEWVADRALFDHPVVHAFCERFGYPPP